MACGQLREAKKRLCPPKKKIQVNRHSTQAILPHAEANIM